MAQPLQGAIKLLQHQQHRPVAAEQPLGDQRLAVVRPLNRDRLRREVLAGKRLQDPQGLARLHAVAEQTALLQQRRQQEQKVAQVGINQLQIVQRQHPFAGLLRWTLSSLHHQSRLSVK